MKRMGSFVVYFMRDETGMLTGRLVEQDFTTRRFVATADTAERVYDQIETQLGEIVTDNPDVIEPFLWAEEVHTEQVVVDVRPQILVQKRAVIAKEAIPIQLTYAWSRLLAEGAREKAGFRVALPRFGWWFVLEELGMAADVLRESIGSALSGESARSLFDFRPASLEYFVSWSPKLLRKRKKAREIEVDLFPVLNRVAEDWTKLARAGKLGEYIGAAATERQQALVRMEKKPSLLMLGPTGVGKTEWVKQLARRSAGAGAADVETRVWATSADRIMAGMTYLGMWEQRCLDIVAELSGEGHFLYVDKLAAFVARQSGDSSLADLFLPALQEGEISLIAECTDAEYERLLARAPTFLSCFELVRIEIPTPEAAMLLIAEHQERHPAAGRMHPDGIRRLVQRLALFRRDHEFPGKAFAFLDWLKQKAPRDAAPVYTPGDAVRLFSRYTGLPEKLVSDDEIGLPEELAMVLGRGVIGQDAACRACADVLVRFKAGVSDPEKPLGSLLFVGPTGVGKTELAKQMARFMFGSAERMVRLDMSEYMTAGSTLRILTDEKGALSLAQRVSQDPLSLVLLDEIEKAHPAVFDLLLGILGEGRLTAQSGRFVDFRMTLIVMTSNLGTDAEPAGFGRDAADGRDVLRAVRQHFRPEFFNRLDYVVPFGTLSAEAVRKIVDLELAAVSRREGLAKRNLRLLVADAAKARLAELGFHPKYGARPLKRAIEEHVMTPISVELSRRPKLADVEVRVFVEAGQIRVAFP